MGPTATMEPAPSVEAASPAKSAATMLRGETAESTATAHSGTAAESTTMPSAFTTEFAATAESAIMSVPTATIESWPATAIKTMEPWTRANKYSTGKIIRSVVAVGRTCVRDIPIVAIRADRGRANVSRSKLNGNLRMGCPCNHHEKPEQNSVL
jgi:hypothetical protein